MSEAAAPIDCPSGHSDTVKLFSMVSVGGLASPSRAAMGPSASGGGCCGGACGCG
jgi:hypothetical protein